MAKDPAFLFYYQDFLVGSDHMTLEQVGGYIKCLCHQANRYTIRASHMEALVGSQGNFNVIREKFVVDTNGELFNQRLREEMEKRSRWTQSRLDNLHKPHMNNHKAHHMDTHMENENEDVNDNVIKKDRIVKERGFKPPTLEEVKSYCKERRNKVNPQAFLSHYETNGWMRGKTKIKDWKACVRTWEITAGFQPIDEMPNRQKTPDPKQQEEVAKLIKQTTEAMK